MEESLPDPLRVNQLLSRLLENSTIKQQRLIQIEICQRELMRM
jgi:hypothetical protein